MPYEFLEQVAIQAPMLGAGTIAGGSGLIAVLRLFKVFSSPQDVELMGQTLRAEFAEKYVSKENLEAVLIPIREDLHYIRQRIDQLR